jgi:hypothetical protein
MQMKFFGLFFILYYFVFRAKNMPPTPPAAEVIVEQEELNVPSCGQSLDPDDQIIWRVQTFSIF